MFDAAPQALDEDVVECSSSAIRADDHAFPFQHIGECCAGELRALVAVEDFRRAAQNTASMLLRTRQLSTRCEYQSMFASW